MKRFLRIFAVVAFIAFFGVIYGCGSGSGSGSGSRSRVNGDYTVSTAVGSVELHISGNTWESTIDGLNGVTHSSGTISGGTMYTKPKSRFEQPMRVGRIEGKTVYYLNHRMNKR